MRINPVIFKVYDIRGIYPKEINESAAERIGAATATFLSKKPKKKRLNILVCYDVRISSPRLKEAFIAGIRATGSNVIDGGMGTTPFMYFLMHELNPDGAVMVTASHNPAPYNGFKIRGKGGAPISWGNGLEVIKKIAFSKKNLISQGPHGEIISLEKDYAPAYIAFLTQGIVVKPLRTVIDASGGSATLLLPALLNKFPRLIYKPLFFEQDGLFRNHLPNPLLPHAQQFVRAELKKGRFCFGAIFDGDGDRIIFFDERGIPINPEFIFALFARDELAKAPKSRFVLPLDATKGVREYVQEHGGRVTLCKRGYPFVKTALRATRGTFAVEKSGHFFFKDFQYDDSALFAWVRLARLLSRTHRPLSALVAPFARYISPEEISFPTREPQRILQRVRSFYQKAGGTISFLDGVKVEFPDWWFNIRPSNTEPLVRLVLETHNKKLYDDKRKELERLIKRR